MMKEYRESNKILKILLHCIKWQYVISICAYLCIWIKHKKNKKNCIKKKQFKTNKIKILY